MKQHRGVRRLASTLILGGALIASPTLARGASAAGAPVTLSDAQVRDRAEALLRQMTAEEKAGQLSILFYLPIPQLAKMNDASAEQGKVGAFLFVTDPKETNRLQRLAVEKSRLKIPLLFGFDVIHGLSTIFPVPIAQAASWDPPLVEDIQAAAARETRAVGVHWTFAPMLDIARDPRWGRIVEGPGEDPFLASAMARAQVRGYQGRYIGDPGHIIAGPKHFAGYGAGLGGRDYDEVDLSDSELWNVYLPPFNAAVEAGAGNIMSAYMGLNGVPASGNHWLLTDVLRKQWGFKGFVVSDNAAVTSLQTHGMATSPETAAAAALDAGVDMEMNIASPAYARLPAQLASGAISEQRLDEAVLRILETKVRMGLFENPYVDEGKAEAVVKAPGQLRLARIAAEKSAVLLRNKGGLLPLDKARLSSVAVLGPLADAARDLVGPWVFNQNNPALSSVLSGIRAKLGKNAAIEFEPGVTLPERLHPSPFAQVVGKIDRPAPADGDDAGIARAVAAARRADVAIVVVGEAQDMIGESASRSSLSLPGRQQDLLDAVVATGKPVVVLLINGRPLDLGATKAAAILDLWYPGSEAGSAAANLVFGDAVPGGKLPFTWPRNVGQVPMIYSSLTSHDPANADKRYWNEAGTPAYPFGFGLSYSHFEYANVRVDRSEITAGAPVRVTADVKNAGQREADEVAQLYIHQLSGSAARPVRELKGFQRITLKPGETRTIQFDLGEAELRYWNAARRDWTLDQAEFDVAVGGDSTAKFSVRFKIVK